MTTQRAIFNYEEVIDLHTEADSVSVIGIHTPTGDTARKLCPGFFEQFKKYKYLGCSVSLVPAATLPADPLSVSYEAGEPTTDPRDLLNPILFHGCHGNDLGNILNRLYSANLADSTDLTQLLHSDSTDYMSMYNGLDDGVPVLQVLESLYYRALTDNTWKKAHVQRGFRKSGLKPRIYSLATNMQIMNASTLNNSLQGPAPIEGEFGGALDPTMDILDGSAYPVKYFTPRTVPLGWLDTRQVVPYVNEGTISDVSLSDLNDTITDIVKGKTVWNELPRIYMGVILLPPAYKTEMYFRMIINHHFAFAGFRGISMSNDMIEMPPNYENWNDLISAHEGDDPDPPEPEPPQPEYEYVTGTGILELYGTKSGTPLNYSVSFSPGLYDDAPDPQTYIKSGGNTDYRISSEVQVIDSNVTVTVVNGGTTNVLVYNKLTNATIVTVEPGTSGSFVFNPADNLGSITSGGNTYSNAFGLMFFGGF